MGDGCASPVMTTLSSTSPIHFDRNPASGCNQIIRRLLLLVMVALVLAGRSIHAQAEEKSNNSKKARHGTSYLHIPGNGEHAELESGILKPWAEFSFGAWVRWEFLGNFSTPFLIEAGDGSSAMMGINSGMFTSGFKFFCLNDGEQLLESHIDDALIKYGWMHIAVSVSDSGYKVFINGNLQVEKSYMEHAGFESGLMAEMFSGDSPPRLTIGKRNHPNNTHFYGDIDDFYLYSRALSEDEVQKLMWAQEWGDSLPQDGREVFCDFQDNGAVSPFVLHGSNIQTLKGSRPTNLHSVVTGFVNSRFRYPVESYDLRAFGGARMFVDGFQSRIPMPVPIVGNGYAEFQVKLPVESSEYTLLVVSGDQIYAGSLTPSYRSDNLVELTGFESAQTSLQVKPQLEGVNQTWLLEAETKPGSDFPLVKQVIKSDQNGVFESVIFPKNEAIYTLHPNIADKKLNIESLMEDGEATQVVPFSLVSHTSSKVFTRIHGLQSKEVSTVFLDRGGNVWAGLFGGGVNILKNGEFFPIPILSGNLARTLFQSNESGKVMVGCEDGLFVVESIRDEESGSEDWKLSEDPRDMSIMDRLAGKSILTGHFDRDGGLWVGTNSGLWFFSGDREFEAEVFHLHSSIEHVIAIDQLKDGRMIISSNSNGIMTVTQDNGGVSAELFYTVNRIFRGRTIYRFSVADNGDVWIAANNGVHKLDPMSGELSVLWACHAREIIQLNHLNIRGKGQDSEAIAFLCNNGRLRILNNGNWSHIENYHQDKISRFQNATADQNGNIWMASLDHGILKINLQTPYKPLNSDENPNEDALLGFDADEFGNVWAIDSDRQLKLIGDYLYGDSGEPQMESYVPEEIGDIQILKYNPFDQSVWVGGSDGIFRMARGGKNVLLTKENWLSVPSINNIQPQENGEVWVSTHGSGAVLLAFDGKIMRRVGSREIGQKDGDYARSVLPVGDDEIYVGSDAGIHILRGDEIVRVPMQPSGDHRSDGAKMRVFDLAWDEGTKSVLVGTELGLYILQSQNDEMDFRPARGIPSVHVNSIQQWTDGRYFIATQGNYLILWDLLFETSSMIGSQFGLKGDEVQKIVRTNDDEFWLDLNKGAVALYPYRTTPPTEGFILNYDDREFHYSPDQSYINISSESGVTISFNEWSVSDQKMSQYYYAIYGENQKLLQEGIYKPGSKPVNVFTKDGNFSLITVGFDEFLNTSEPAIYQVRKSTPFLYSSDFAYISIIVVSLATVMIFLLFGRQWKLTRVIEDERAQNIAQLQEKNHELEMALNKANSAFEAKGRFLANMSHEIRTPMNGIIGMTELLGHTRMSEEQKEYRDTISRCAGGLLRIINDILDFSKLEAGKLKVEMTEFNPRNIIQDILSMHRVVAQQKGIEVGCHIEKQIPAVLIGDSLRIKQILDNLLSNAIKFTSKGAVNLSISHLKQTEDHQCTVRFEVADQGIGIPPAKINDIFSAFDQVDISTTRKYGGTGLGLSITRELVQLLGGTIDVQSEEGKGTTFLVDVPFEISLEPGNFSQEAENDSSTVSMLPPEPECEGEASSDPGDSSNLVNVYDVNMNRGQILLVEDNLVNQRVISRMLTKIGFEVDIAANGLDAVEMVNQPDNPYSLIFMDCQMPVMDGYAATREIKKYHQQDGKDNRVVIIALSANTFDKDKNACFEAGMDEFVPKPVSVQALRTVIDNYKDCLHASHPLTC